ncbi:MAG: hypothetical protein KDA96_16300, partial [Planctomycetaceae bacterium]|nr:hypothetical protein [Planctomycetaceae bacterium]
ENLEVMVSELRRLSGTGAAATSTDQTAGSDIRRASGFRTSEIRRNTNVTLPPLTVEPGKAEAAVKNGLYIENDESFVPQVPDEPASAEPASGESREAPSLKPEPNKETLPPPDADASGTRSPLLIPNAQF